MDSMKKNIPLGSKAQWFERLGESVYLFVVKIDFVDFISNLGKHCMTRQSISLGSIFKKFIRAISSSKSNTLVLADPSNLIVAPLIERLCSVNDSGKCRDS
jgi:hypothetical protein